MLLPKKTKYRKQMRGRLKNDANTGNKLSFGSFALQATARGYLTNRQIESARRVITRSLKRGGKIWIRVFPEYLIATVLRPGMNAQRSTETDLSVDIIIVRATRMEPSLLRP